MARDTRAPHEILEHIIEARVALTSALYGLSEERLTDTSAFGTWSCKEIMGHLGRWEEVCYQVIQDHLKGIEPTENYNEEFLAFNDRWEPELRALSLSKVVTLFEAAHYRLFGLLNRLQPEQWDIFVRGWTQVCTYGHFEEHTHEIQTWRKSLG
jgi:hypothetical protein